MVQWRVTCNLDTLWQRFGRGARGPETFGLAILIVEGKYFDDDKTKKKARLTKKAEKNAQKAVEKECSKRTRVGDRPEMIGLPNKRSRIGEGIERTGEPAELTAFEQLRVEYRKMVALPKYAAQGRCARDGKGDGEDSIHPEMDILINAEGQGVGCFRIPIMAFYENDCTQVRLH